MEVMGIRKNTFYKRALPVIALATGIAMFGNVQAENEVKEGIPKSFPSKKLIAVGWDSPSPQILFENLKQIEETPFDGLAIQVEANGDNNEKISFTRAFSGIPWKKEWFETQIDFLKKAHSKKLTDNFLLMGAGSAVDWFDDAGWAQVIEHFRIAAWIAKTAGIKGLMFDPELGSSHQPAFCYSSQTQKRNHSFSEYSAKIRQRGRELMEAMAGEYPDMTFFSLFLDSGPAYSVMLRQGGVGNQPWYFYINGNAIYPSGPTNPEEVQEQDAPLENVGGGAYNMLPAFLNGMLDVIPSGMTLVDGLEATYTKTTKEDFSFWANLVRNTALTLVSEENKAKYRAQVEVGFGIYLDAYTNPVGSRHFVGPPDTYKGPAEGMESNSARMNRLLKTVSIAANISDKYVWVWGEKYRWWPTSSRLVSSQSWDDIAPNISNILKDAMDPSSGIKKKLLNAREKFSHLEQSGNLENLIKNGNFSSLSDHTWTEFKNENSSQGTISLDAGNGHSENGRACLSGVSDGGFFQEVEIGGASAFYVIRGWVHQVGSGEAKIRIRWKIPGKKGEKWLTAYSDNIILTPEKGDNTTHWKEIFGMVVTPPGATKMAIQLEASNQSTSQDVILYDDIGLYKLP